MANFENYDDLLNKTLGELEKKGSEEAKAKKNNKNRNKNKNKNKGGENRPSSSTQENQSSSSKKTEYNLDLPELKLEPEEDFEIKPEIEEKEITNPVTFEETHKKIGEEVSEEYVEKLMEEKDKPDGGHRATVIIHTRTITGEVAPVSPPEDFEIPDDETDEEDSEAALLKQIKEAEEKEAGAAAPTPSHKVSLVRKDTGEIYEIRKKTVIGRESGDIVIPEPDGKYLSDPHATFTIDDKGKVKIREREGGTTNGTFVNRNRVASKYLKSGDLVKLGNLEFILEIE